MKLLAMGCFIIMMMLLVAESHPVHMICMPSCNANITASEQFVEEWLNHSSNMSTIINMVMSDASTKVIDNLYTLLYCVTIA